MKYALTAGNQPLPLHYYNILADLPGGLKPALHPQTRQPLTPADLAPLFPEALIEQEVSLQRYIPIPDPVLEAYAGYRPTPLLRARRLEQQLDTPARIYYKYEGVSPAGSHKLNTALAQAFYNRQAGIRRLVTETGAGQWGSALAYAGCRFGLEVLVYMVNASYRQKPYRRLLMETWGAQVVASPSELTPPGRAMREGYGGPGEHPGSLGIAISEAVFEAATSPETHYSLGSVLNHVLLHQTVIGLEAREQLRQQGEHPDSIIGCHGGGSNLGGLALPFMRDRLDGAQLEFIAAEPASCPTLTRGQLGYDFGDSAGLAPLLPMHSLGHSFIPSAIHAGGLRYHGAAPLISRLVELGLLRAQAYSQREVFEAALLFTRCEGHLPAPESAHAVKAAIDSALAAKAEGRPRTLLFSLSGHGHFDLAAYEAYLHSELTDSEAGAEELAAALASVPQPVAVAA
jgi:tryptophan synthase beta chain